MASFHKVIKLLKFKSAANLHCFQWEAQSRARDRMKRGALRHDSNKEYRLGSASGHYVVGVPQAAGRVRRWLLQLELRAEQLRESVGERPARLVDGHAARELARQRTHYARVEAARAHEREPAELRAAVEREPVCRHVLRRVHAD